MRETTKRPTLRPAGARRGLRQLGRCGIGLYALMLALTACKLEMTGPSGSGSGCGGWFMGVSTCGWGPFSFPAVTVEITAPSTSVAVGRQVQLSATARDSAGAVLTNRTFTWSSASPGIAIVDRNGLVTGVGVGAVTISAFSDSDFAVGDIALTVVVPVASRVTVPSSAVVVR